MEADQRTRQIGIFPIIRHEQGHQTVGRKRECRRMSAGCTADAVLSWRRQRHTNRLGKARFENDKVRCGVNLRGYPFDNSTRAESKDVDHWPIEADGPPVRVQKVAWG